MKLSIGVVLFEDFELLDVFGPLEMFGLLPEYFSIHLVAEKTGYIASAQGPRSVVDHTFDDTCNDRGGYDILLVPGGRGTRTEVHNRKLLGWLSEQSVNTKFTTSVCTGSALLAKSGVLDGRRATTNKAAFEWVKSQGENVKWVPQARWVEDDKFFTSSGVSAGMDMSLGLIRHILGAEMSEKVANWVEYTWHADSTWDPFAKLHNLV